MSTAAVVLVCALEVLGRSADRLPPIRILDTPPSAVSANANAFVNPDEGVIYLIASAPAFRMAQAEEPSPGHCSGREAVKMVASIIVHEEWHLKHGEDERGAYEAQLTELIRLGLESTRWPYRSVLRAMLHVLDAKSRRAFASPRTISVVR
jgi:hypothetical protein